MQCVVAAPAVEVCAADHPCRHTYTASSARSDGPIAIALWAARPRSRGQLERVIERKVRLSGWLVPTGLVAGRRRLLPTCTLLHAN